MNVFGGETCEVRIGAGPPRARTSRNSSVFKNICITPLQTLQQELERGRLCRRRGSSNGGGAMGAQQGTWGGPYLGRTLALSHSALLDKC